MEQKILASEIAQLESKLEQKKKELEEMVKSWPDEKLKAVAKETLVSQLKENNEAKFAIETAEKVQISRNANIGAYYFAKGRDFIWAAEEMIDENDKTNGEFYIAPVYNYLIRRGKLIRLSRPRFVHGLGTPKVVEKFLEFLKRGEIQHSFTNLSLT